VLILLVILGEVTANKICEFGKMDKGNVSRAVNRLVKKGNVTEKLNPRGQKEFQPIDNSWWNEIILPYKNIV
jgi:DNA-binding MarR family transcriptional regulator